jgi:hypothetical protein
MGLSKKDKQWIKNTFRELICEFLTIKVKMEENKDKDTGKPLATPRMVEKDVFLPAWWVEYLPYYEGAMRGLQKTQDNTLKAQEESINKQADELKKLSVNVTAMAGIMLGVEDGIKKTVEIAARQNIPKQIIFTEESKLSKLENIILRGVTKNERKEAMRKWSEITGCEYVLNKEKGEQ